MPRKPSGLPNLTIPPTNVSFAETISPMSTASTPSNFYISDDEEDFTLSEDGDGEEYPDDFEAEDDGQYSQNSFESDDDSATTDSSNEEVTAAELEEARKKFAAENNLGSTISGGGATTVTSSGENIR